MRWLVRESRPLSVLGCAALKLTGRSMNLEGETAATGLHLGHIQTQNYDASTTNPPGATFRSYTNNSTI